MMSDFGGLVASVWWLFCMLLLEAYSGDEVKSTFYCQLLVHAESCL